MKSDAQIFVMEYYNDVDKQCNYSDPGRRQ